MPKILKETLIKQERERLDKVFSRISHKQRVTVDGLIDRAAFMRVTLEELEKEINNAGVIESYHHGKDNAGVKASAATQAYNSTIKNYTAVIKQLVSLLPEEAREGAKKNSLMELLEQSRMEKASAAKLKDKSRNDKILD